MVPQLQVLLLLAGRGLMPAASASGLPQLQPAHASGPPSMPSTQATDDEVDRGANAATTLPRLPALQMHWLGNDTEARCMDGSRYGYYFRPASSADGAKKWVIEMCVRNPWTCCF